MTELVVDLAKLRGAVDRMARFEQDVTTVLSDVDHAMVGLRATWHGDASDSQAAAQARWDEGAEQMRKSLVALREIAAQAHANYSNAVDQNKKMWEV